MLRATLEIIPDDKRMRSHGTVVRVIDIKEDGTGSWQHGNYKTKFYLTPGAMHNTWRHKQVVGLKYKEYTHEKLLYLALEPFLRDQENKTIEQTNTTPLDRIN